MYNINVPTDSKRARYQRALDALQISDKDYIINEHTLRMEKLLAAGQNSYKFDFYQNPGADRVQENKLNRNDVLVITHIALCLAKQDTNASPANYGNYPLYTFPDPLHFLGEPASGLNEWECLENVYNGKLSVKTNNTDRLQSFLTNHFRYVPERTYDSNDVTPQYGPDLHGRGFVDMEPLIILNGQQNNTAELEIGSGDTTVIAGGIDGSNNAVDTSNILVLLVHGFLVNEAAEAALKYG